MKKIALSLIIFIVLLLLTNCNQSNYTYTIKTMFDSPLLIPHAGGITPEGRTESNSLEALEKSYKDGYRVIELDFSWLEDSHLVCVHDWYAFYSAFHSQKNPTFDKFNEIRSTTYDFTSLTLDHLASWLKSHRDAVIITDIKEDNVRGAELISDKYPELLQQFIIQIYDPEEYEQISALGFENIILTLYNMPMKEKLDADGLVEFISDNKLLALTFPVEMLDLKEWFVKLKGSNVPLMVHTVNNINEQRNLLEAGISGIYTDLTEFVI